MLMTFQGTLCQNQMPDIVIVEGDVLDAVKDINVNKSSTLENISTHVFKDAALIMPKRFTKILNLAVVNQHIPVSWKIAKVTPLPKSGDIHNVSNYRPISQLPIPGKILERLIHTQISQLLEKNNILTEIQGGYRKSHSTLDTINKLTSDILK